MAYVLFTHDYFLPERVVSSCRKLAWDIFKFCPFPYLHIKLCTGLTMYMLSFLPRKPGKFLTFFSQHPIVLFFDRTIWWFDRVIIITAYRGELDLKDLIDSWQRSWNHRAVALKAMLTRVRVVSATKFLSAFWLEFLIIRRDSDY